MVTSTATATSTAPAATTATDRRPPAMAKPILAPARLFQADATTLGIAWNDGHESRYPVRDLRLACPCAHCIQEWTGEVMVKPELIAADVHPLDLETVGNYGLRIQWSDGHATGIYTWERLRAFCGCAACGGPKDPLTLSKSAKRSGPASRARPRAPPPTRSAPTPRPARRPAAPACGRERPPRPPPGARGAARRSAAPARPAPAGAGRGHDRAA